MPNMLDLSVFVIVVVVIVDNIFLFLLLLWFLLFIKTNTAYLSVFSCCSFPPSLVAMTLKSSLP